MKNQYIGGDCLKGGGGLGQFADLRGELGRKEGGGVFEGALIPQCTLCLVNRRKNIHDSAITFMCQGEIKNDRDSDNFNSLLENISPKLLW